MNYIDILIILSFTSWTWNVHPFIYVFFNSSTLFCIFHCMSLSPPYLIPSVWCCYIVLFFVILFQIVHCRCTKMRLIFVCWLYDLLLLKFILVLVVFFSLMDWGFLYIRSYHPWTDALLLLFFQFGWPFFFFFLFNCTGQNFSTVSSRSGKSGYLVCSLSYRKSFQSFTIDYDVHWQFFINDFYYGEVVSFYSSGLSVFYHEKVLNFVRCFFTSIGAIMCFFFCFILSVWLIILIDFHMLNHP